MTDTHWSLKILSGAHSGAEIDLAPGSYTLGRHEDCDFVLTDDTLADQQLEISITDNGIELKSLSNDTFIINGEDLGAACTPEQHQLIALSSLSFAFGKPGTPWPSFSPAPPQTPAATDTNADSSDAASANTMTNQEQTQEKTLDQNPDTTADTVEGSTKKRGLGLFSFKSINIRQWIKTSLHRYRWLLAGLTAAGVLAAFAMGFLWFWQQTAPDTTAKPVNYLEVAENIRTKLMLPDTHIRRMANGSILISGYIADNVKKNALIQQMESKNVPLKTQIIVMSDMRAAAVTALKMAGYGHMHVELDTTPGSLVLSGYAPNAKYVTKIRELLSTEVPGLLSIVEQVEYQSTREKALRTMLQEAGLNTHIKLLEQPGRVTLKGRLNDISQGYRFKEIVNNFREKYGKRPELAIDVTIPSTNLNTLRPELDIKSISLGRTPYVILGDGEKYLPGAKLENGYILESIGLDYLILRLGQQRIKYNVRHSHD